MPATARPTLTNYQVSLRWPVPRRRPAGAFAQARELVRTWRLRMRQRAELARLDQRDLHDIGRSEADVQHELAKWFWQA